MAAGMLIAIRSALGAFANFARIGLAALVGAGLTFTRIRDTSVKGYCGLA